MDGAEEEEEETIEEGEDGTSITTIMMTTIEGRIEEDEIGPALDRGLAIEEVEIDEEEMSRTALEEETTEAEEEETIETMIDATTKRKEMLEDKERVSATIE